MKAIVVVFFRTRKPETSQHQLRLRATSALAAPANASGERVVSPLWTWFIENPRFPRSNGFAPARSIS